MPQVRAMGSGCEVLFNKGSLSEAQIWAMYEPAEAMMMRPRLLRPERRRDLEPPFGWIPMRLLTSGWLQKLSQRAKLLYFFLCLVADGRGVSFYGEPRLSKLLDLSGSELAKARGELCRLDLVAFDGRVYQLLSLPRNVTPVSRQPAISPETSPKRDGGVQHIGEILQGILTRG